MTQNEFEKEDPEPLLSVESLQMQNKQYRLAIWNYAFNQYRIQLIHCDTNNIVRELCTYRFKTAVKVIGSLQHSADPEKECEKWAVYPKENERYDGDSHNCEFKQGRIRLDQPAKNPIEI